MKIWICYIFDGRVKFSVDKGYDPVKVVFDTKQKAKDWWQALPDELREIAFCEELVVNKEKVV